MRVQNKMALFAGGVKPRCTCPVSQAASDPAAEIAHKAESSPKVAAVPGAPKSRGAGRCPLCATETPTNFPDSADYSEGCWDLESAARR